MAPVAEADSTKGLGQLPGPLAPPEPSLMNAFWRAASFVLSRQRVTGADLPAFQGHLRSLGLGSPLTAGGPSSLSVWGRAAWAQDGSRDLREKVQSSDRVGFLVSCKCSVWTYGCCGAGRAFSLAFGPFSINKQEIGMGLPLWQALPCFAEFCICRL